MTLTKIFSGMESGPEAIDANFNALDVEVSDWSNTGITYINGFSQHSEDLPNSLKYRTIKVGGVLIETQFAGYINNPASTSSQGVVEFCKIPSNLIKDGFTLLSNKHDYIATNQHIIYDYRLADSALTISLWGLTKDVGAGTIQTNVCFSW